MDLTLSLAFDKSSVSFFPSYNHSVKEEVLFWTAAWPTDFLLDLFIAKKRDLRLICVVKKNVNLKSVS